MGLDDYTPDAICDKLDVGPFRPIARCERCRGELKVLLCPSFKPEVCLVFREHGAQTQVRVACAKPQIWGSAFRRVKVLADSGRFREPTLAELERRFRSAIAKPDERDIAVLDGMRVHIAWHLAHHCLLLENAQPSLNEPLKKFVGSLIVYAFDSIADSYCRDCLVDAANYVGIHGLPRSSANGTDTNRGPLRSWITWISDFEAWLRRLFSRR